LASLNFLRPDIVQYSIWQKIDFTPINTGWSSRSVIFLNIFRINRLFYRLDDFSKQIRTLTFNGISLFYCSFFGGLECAGHSFANVVHFVFLKDVWIRTQTAVVVSRRATNFATHLPGLATWVLEIAVSSIFSCFRYLYNVKIIELSGKQGTQKFPTLIHVVSFFFAFLLIIFCLL
jgi:hypothetical protein